MIRSIIIDDEPSAISVLEILLKGNPHKDIEIIGIYTLPEEGREMILKLKPDLVFIDVEMPVLTGIDLIKSIPHPTFGVIFVTAYNKYAIEAFRLSAIDYLLKPVDRQQVEEALRKVRQDQSNSENQIQKRIQVLEDYLATQALDSSKLAIGAADEIFFVQINEILFCEADGSYTQIHMTGGRRYVSSKSIGAFEEYLLRHGFFRIHHHSLINLAKIKSFQRKSGGHVIMENDRKLEVAARRYKAFLDVVREFMI